MTRCQDNAGSGTQEYVKIAQGMCEDSGTAVRCAVGVTEGVQFGGGPAARIGFEHLVLLAPTIIMFADDIVICNEVEEHEGQELESWIYALERRGMQLHKKKTVTYKRQTTVQ